MSGYICPGVGWLDHTVTLFLRFLGTSVREGNGTPLQCSCLEDPRDGGAWWAAINGIAESRTRLSDLAAAAAEAGTSVCFLQWLYEPTFPQTA